MTRVAVATSRGRRGFVLLSVMMVIGIALFVAATLMLVMQSDAALVAGSRSIEQSRALARSGLEVIVQELNAQRDVILDGDIPQLDAQYVLFEDDSEFGIVRVLPVGPSGDLLEAEAGKLDLNSVDADALERTGFVEPQIARAIIEYRDQTLGRPFQSVAELLSVKDITPEMLYGPIEDLTVLDDAQLDAGDVGERVLAMYGDDALRGLADLVTVFSFEPDLQRNGVLRINLNVPWSEELRRRVADRFGEDVANGVQRIFEQGYTFEGESQLYNLLLYFKVDPKDWVDALDSFAFQPYDYAAGRLDLNTASYEALRALPDLEPEQADAIVDAREGLARDDRTTVAWPAIEGICEPQQYAAFGGHITTRCWNWRVRLAAGTTSIDDPDGPLQRPVIYEAVIDLSAPQARIAYLRDITHLQTAAIIAANASLDDEPDRDRETFSRLGADFSDDPGDVDDDSPNAGGSDRNLDFSGDNFESDDDSVRQTAEPDHRVIDRSGTQRADHDGDADERAGDSVGGGLPPSRRVGRWRPGE